jgi:GTP pyrophosphokinase
MTKQTPATLHSVKEKIRTLFAATQTPSHEQSPINEKLEIIDQAFALADAAHRGQLRKNGEDYIVHPLAVAQILADLKLDVPAIAAGLLHDTVEDTTVTLEQIQTQFGLEIANLVDGVTKLSKIQFQTQEETQAENYRKMILAMSRDIRVIMIKLADRLSNMRTLKALSTEKQRLIAQETLDIYAPIANRLGLSKIKSELEDLCLRHLNPAAYYGLTEKIAKTQAERERFITEIKGLLESKLAEYQIEAKIVGRAKHFYSIYRKMQLRQVEFEEIYDLIAFRIIVKDIPECYRTLGVIHACFKPVQTRFKDYIAMPKSNGYQSLHTTVIGPTGEHVEVQVRTPLIHQYSQQGIAAHWRYKEGKFDIQSYGNLDWIHRLLQWHQDLKDPSEFLETIKIDLFEEDVFVFTPKGAVKQLPFDATPVDFAYSVHTQLGNRCIGSKVNGKMVPLRTKLKSGDMVEILVGKNQNPSQDWLAFVKSSRAKNKIRNFFKLQAQQLALKNGRKLLEKALHNFPQTLAQIEKSKELSMTLQNIGVKSLDELFIKLGQEKISCKTVLFKLFGKTSADPPPAAPEQSSPGPAHKTLAGSPKEIVRVSDISGIAITLAKCCSPVPYDPIIARITRRHTAAIHVLGCPTARDTNIPLLPCQWTVAATAQTYRVRLRIITMDIPGMLALLSQIISSSTVNIASAHAHTTLKKGIFTYTILVHSAAEVDHVIQTVQTQKGVISAMRLQTSLPKKKEILDA